MENEKSLYRDMMYDDSDREKEIKVRGDKWKIRPPITHIEKINFKKQRHILLNGLELHNIKYDELVEIENLTYVVVSVIDGPGWYKESYDSNPLNMPDDGLVRELAEEILKHKEDLEKKIQQGKFGHKSPSGRTEKPSA